ncbi:MAG: sulfite exporter TauE/SafE family protein [Actinomycetota bacterium]|nr:sulfite exporter TauE/SafE family protein [Actinomycetota bacterium]
MVAAVAVLSLAVAAGAVIQGSIGFGYALVAVPAMVLLLPWAVPVTPLFLALPMTLLMSAREWRSIDLGGFVLITGGRLIGTVVGVGLLVLAPQGYLSVLTGLLILAAALGSFLRPTFEVNDRTRLAGGVASGVVGTVAALGGTPLALVYQDRSGAELRSTLAISFVVGIAMSLVGLALAGKVEGRHVVLALELLPGLLIGLLVSRWVVERLDERWLRPAVLAFAAVAGLVIVLLGL